MGRCAWGEALVHGALSPHKSFGATAAIMAPTHGRLRVALVTTTNQFIFEGNVISTRAGLRPLGANPRYETRATGGFLARLAPTGLSVGYTVWIRRLAALPCAVGPVSSDLCCDTVVKQVLCGQQPLVDSFSIRLFYTVAHSSATLQHNG